MLEKVIVIFRYLQDKDVFENFYKTHLSKRLLGGRSVSDEVDYTRTWNLCVCLGFIIVSFRVRDTPAYSK